MKRTLDPTFDQSGGVPVKRLLILVAACMFAAAPAFAADTAPAAAAPNSQNDKMKACSAEGKGKTGDEYKQFMKTCLAAKPAAAAKPESKMSMCNKQTAGMSGDARAKAQSECMKGPAKAS
jgi:hypothetical protein